MQNPYLTDEVRLLYAKTFHDLAVPLGALTLCVDDIKKALPESAEIVEASIETLSNKIRHWRLMLTGGEGGPNFSEAMDVMKELARLKNVGIVFCSSGDYQGVFTRLLLALTLVCIESLPRGGEVEIDPEKGEVKASGQRCFIPKELQDALLQPIEQPSSRHALGLLIVNLAKDSGCSLGLKHGPTELVFELAKK